jgi:hypothetical protein
MDRGPTGPSAPVSRSLGASEVRGLVAAALSGRVVDSVNGEPIAGARIQAGEAEVESDASGLFSLPSSLSGLVPLRVEAAGHFPRETRIHLAAPTSVAIDLIPEGEKFDLDFFDHIFRELGDDGTHRWAAEPAFQILDRVLDCVDLDPQEYCNVFEVTEEPAAEQFFSLSERVILEDAASYTGGLVTGARLARVEAAPGTQIVRREAWVRDAVRFALVRLPNDYSWSTWWYYRETESLYSGFVTINKAHKSLRSVYSHELAHALGFAHPRGGWEVPLPSIMRYGHGDGPEPNDVLHGAVLYRRPSGSRTPDRDPENFLLNAIRTTEGTGELVERIAN